MEKYESILGAERATAFAQSLQELQSYYETRQQKLDAVQRQIELERQEVATKLQTLRLFLSGGTDSIDLTAISTITLEPSPRFALVESQGSPTITTPLSVIPATEEALEVQTKTNGTNLVPTLTSSNGKVTADAVSEAPKTRRKRGEGTTKTSGKGRKAAVQETDIPPSSEAQPARRGRKKQTVVEAPEGKTETGRKERDFDSSSLRLREYRDLTMLDAIAAVMSRRAGEELHVDDVVNDLYGKRLSKTLYQKVKYITNKALSRGKQANRWRSVAGRLGYYVFPTEITVL